MALNAPAAICPHSRKGFSIMSTAPSDSPALLAIDGAVATLTLNRPNAFNAIDIAIAKRLEQLAAEVEADPAIRAVVIEGAGRAFCGGGDVQVFGANLDNIEPVARELLHHFHAFIAALRRMPKIVIASVHGSAAGAGLSLATIADLCIAADDAKFTAAYHKLGVSPDGGGTLGLTELVGARRALQIFLADGSFSAQQAYDWGMVTQLVPAAGLRQATRDLAQRIAQNPPAAIAATKALIHQARATPLAQQLDAEVEGIVGCMKTDAFRTAVGKFLSKSK